MNDAALNTLGEHLVIEKSVGRTICRRESVDLLIGRHLLVAVAAFPNRCTDADHERRSRGNDAGTGEALLAQSVFLIIQRAVGIEVRWLYKGDEIPVIRLVGSLGCRTGLCLSDFFKPLLHPPLAALGEDGLEVALEQGASVL